MCALDWDVMDVSEGKGNLPFFSFFTVDGMVSKEEFVMGWAMATNETLKRSELFFHMLDVNMDGGIKEDDIKILFDGTDVYPGQ